MARKTCFILLTFFLVSCEDPIEIALPRAESQLVVEGWVTSELRRQEIRLSRTQGFNEPSQELLITTARVTVTDGQNTIFPYQINDDGVYYSDSAFAGVEGRFYQLQVILENADTISSPFEMMPQLVPIEAITFGSFLRRSEENPREMEEFFFPITFSQDPSTRRNFYRWRISRNGIPFNSPNDIELLDDAAINGNFFPNEFRSFEFNPGDIAQVELLSINRGAFEFLSLLKSQTTSLGTASGTSPSNIGGNLFNITNDEVAVLGYFSCYNVSLIEATFMP